ncbi:uncharacterized protein [Magallana gigas]|uniref:uncharacterized protein isoform X2 n=1 Tax=Magallana gigas TaxID=29159 RepID=UPI003341D73E
MAASNYTSYFAFVMMLSTIISSMSQTEQKEGVRIETVYAPSPGCYGVNYGDFYIGVENMTLADGTVLTTSYMPRTDVVKKGWYLGKRAKGIDIGLQGACKGEIRNITIPPHLMFGIEKDKILDIVPESEKSYLEDFLYADLNGDFLVDVKEIEYVLTNERGLRQMLSSALGMDNIAELAVQWFDSLGDGALDREEYFTMSKTINLEQLRKDANSDSNLESINQNSKEEL